VDTELTTFWPHLRSDAGPLERTRHCGGYGILVDQYQNRKGLKMSEQFENTRQDSQAPLERHPQEAVEQSKMIAIGSTAPIEQETRPVQKRKRRLKKVPPIISHDHPDWDEFIDLLLKSLGGRGRGNCDGRADKTVAILWKFRGIDIGASLEYFSNHGGYCDCEILVNVDKSILNSIKSASSAD
jgi:hypothetical protein